eukprot:TRINITY_DN61065_c0_g1_i1.p1 TRINITY_DN61065_c0_g1~~TRINITY_DN61065_c0_g1_i1.p1  ORF type:complete len:195 (-),score=28.43 TRINITY_DN61065_c0_g1_i1:246-830(-)
MEDGAGVWRGVSQSNMPLMIQIVAEEKMSPSKLRQELQQIWQTIGLLSALLFTMQNFTSPATCDSNFCRTGHGILSGIALLSSIASLTCSVTFQTNIGFVPDSSLCDFLGRYETSMQAPTVCLFLGSTFWVLDAGLLAFTLHGMVLGYMSLFAIVVFLAWAFCLYFRMRKDVRVELQVLSEAENKLFHSDNTTG